MTITPAGYVFFAVLAFSIMLAVGVFRRLRKNGKPAGVGAGVFFGIAIVTISSLFAMAMIFGTYAIYQVVSAPKYDATIISYESAWESVERTDSDGDTYVEEVLMHTPTLQFTDNAGQLITQAVSSQGSVPRVGKTVRVAYLGEGVIIVSAAFVAMLAMGFMTIILGYITTALSCFALGLKPKWLETAGTTVFAMVFFGAMFGMLGAMIYGVYKYFQPGSDMPLWTMLMCAFFSVVLVLSLIAIFTGLKEEHGS